MPGLSYTRTEPTTPPRNTRASTGYLIGYLAAMTDHAIGVDHGFSTLDREVLAQTIDRLQGLLQAENTATSTHNEGSFS